MADAKEFILKNGDHISIKDETARSNIQTLSTNKLDKPSINGTSGQALTIDDNGNVVWGNVGGGAIGYDEENERLYGESSSGSGGSINNELSPGRVTVTPSEIEFNNYRDPVTVEITSATGSVDIDSYNTNDVEILMHADSENGTIEGIFDVVPANGGVTESKTGSVDLYIKSNDGYSANKFQIPYVMKYNNDIPYVSWGEGTVEQIQELFRLDRLNTISLNAFWHLGDERIIHLNAIPQYKNANNRVIVNAIPETDLVFVLLQKGLYLDENEQEVNYVIGAKNMPNALALINYDTANYPGWFDSDLNDYLQNYFYPALDDNDKPLFKQFICKANRNETNDRTTNTMDTRIQKITIPSIVEVYGNTVNSNYVSDIELAQLTQLGWYAQSNVNITKYIGTGTTSRSYWLRSQYPTSKTMYTSEYSTTSPNYKAMNNLSSYYIAPQLCI